MVALGFGSRLGRFLKYLDLRSLFGVFSIQ